METRTNRRIYKRFESSDLADLEMYNQNGSFVYRTMGLVRNISKGGLLLETHVALDQAGIVVAVLDLGDEIIETAGRAVHVNLCGANHYCNGIEFLKSADSLLENRPPDSDTPKFISEPA